MSSAQHQLYRASDKSLDDQLGPLGERCGESSAGLTGKVGSLESSAPLLHGEEWANALVHAGGAMAAILGGVILARAAAEQNVMTIVFA